MWQYYGLTTADLPTDFKRWRTIATKVGRHADLPRDNKIAWFFRSTIPQE
jgi:hypothetical protein